MHTPLFAEAAALAADLADTLDAEARFPAEALRMLADRGLMGLPYPVALGGGGASYTDYIKGVELLAQACASTAVVYCTHVALACHPLFAFGTAAQQQTFLRPLLRGECLGAFALTEPEAGTDVGSMATRATRVGQDYVLHGRKTFITNAGQAGVYIVFARTADDRRKGLSAFVVTPDDAGFCCGDVQPKLGIRAAHTRELFFEGVRLSADRLLGAEGQGFRIAMATLDGGRVGIAAQATGIAAAALNLAVQRLKSREQFGKPLSSFQGLRWKAADMALRVQMARLLTLEAARCRDAGQPCSVPAAMAKLQASETAMRCAEEAIQLFGGAGYLQGSTVERLFRDARITTIYEGTSEVQRMVIADALFA